MDEREIVVTPGMIEAGERELLSFDRRYEGEDEKAAAVFAAMARAGGFRLSPAGLSGLILEGIRTAVGPQERTSPDDPGDAPEPAPCPL